MRRYVRYGASPAAPGTAPRGKARLFSGRYNAALEDVRWAAYPALRHRLIPTFEADAEGITADQIIAELLAAVEVHWLPERPAVQLSGGKEGSTAGPTLVLKLAAKLQGLRLRRRALPGPLR